MVGIYPSFCSGSIRISFPVLLSVCEWVGWQLPRLAGLVRATLGPLPRILLFMSSVIDQSQPPLRPDAFGESCRHLWMLDPDIHFLNHGSFGAVPREVLEVQSRWRDRIERHPVELIDRRMPELLELSLDAAEDFVRGASCQNAFMGNATSAINAVVRSLSFNARDTIATTSHVYNAVRKTLQWVARRDGADYVEFDVPLPVQSSEDLLDRLLESMPDSTRLLLIDQVSSPTGLVFPIEPLLHELVPRGVSVLIDGAHAPGMLDVNVRKYLDLGAIAWTGNFHKWCFAPKGCAVLEVHPSVADRVQPAVISHHAEEPFYKRFQWQGTADFTPWLSVPDALAFADRHFGWPTLMSANHELVTWAHRMLSQEWGVDPISPLDGSMLGSIATIELPGSACRAFDDPFELQAHLYRSSRVEVPVMDWGERWYIRVSAQAYNSPDDYRALAEAVLAIKS